MKEFEHGGDIFKFAKSINCTIDEVIDLSSNINFVKPKIDLKIDFFDLYYYPNYQEFYLEVAKYFGVNKENLELFNGATVAIERVLNFLKRDSKICAIYSPAYLEYKRVAKNCGFETLLLNRFNKEVPLPPKNSVIIFVNPSTPDGKFYNLKKILKKWQELNCKVIIDESFLEFYSPKYSLLNYLENLENIFMIKSMTKFFGSAGVRVGGVISNKDFITSLKAKEPLWKISTFDMKYIQKALRDKTFYERSFKLNLISKEFLFKSLKQSKIISQIYPSKANFFLCKLKIPAKKFQEDLKSFKIMVRDCSNFDFLGENFVRVAVKDLDSMKKFAKALN